MILSQKVSREGRLAACIVCGTKQVRAFLNLGRTALANKFLTQEECARPEPTFPLEVGFCTSCSHVQLMDHVPPSAMFTDYLYISSASDALAAHLVKLSDGVVGRFRLGPSDLVMDIGCNDGTLLKGFQRHGVKTLGVDPAVNLAPFTDASGIERFTGFFNSQTARHIVARWGKAAAITATNTFPHIPDLEDFIKGVRSALAPGGVFVIEAHYLQDLLEQGAFDTIYHEHVSYWALRPMQAAFERLGMHIVDVERIPFHHGQLRVFVQREGEGAVQPSVAGILEEEKDKGLDRFDIFQRFAERTYRLKEKLWKVLNDLLVRGKRLAGYGAPAKGNTLLSFLGMGPEVLKFIADRSPLKQGRYTPGTHVPVVPPERLLEDQPDYVLLLAWNFADEVLRQQDEYRRRGGRFILPFPEAKII
ncbi:MAG: class I SAM-dependent methyltransferase [Candidatus Omnitrophica bacterium]|nr:class I SAM-dependent methyltransferase [Candidatus Omnitrophota bacterium]